MQLSRWKDLYIFRKSCCWGSSSPLLNHANCLKWVITGGVTLFSIYFDETVSLCCFFEVMDGYCWRCNFCSYSIVYFPVILLKTGWKGEARGGGLILCLWSTQHRKGSCCWQYKQDCPWPQSQLSVLINEQSVFEELMIVHHWWKEKPLMWPLFDLTGWQDGSDSNLHKSCLLQAVHSGLLFWRGAATAVWSPWHQQQSQRAEGSRFPRWHGMHSWTSTCHWHFPPCCSFSVYMWNAFAEWLMGDICHLWQNS